MPAANHTPQFKLKEGFVFKRSSWIFAAFLAAMFLACGGGGGGSTNTAAPVAAPSITSFTAAKSTITAGESTTLTAAFANGTGAIDKSVGAVTNGTPVTVTPATTTTYTLTVTNAQGATVTSTATITVIKPALTISPSRPVIKDGESLNLTAFVDGMTGQEVEWILVEGSINGNTLVSTGPSTAVFQANPNPFHMIGMPTAVQIQCRLKADPENLLTSTVIINDVTSFWVFPKQISVRPQENFSVFSVTNKAITINETQVAPSTPMDYQITKNTINNNYNGTINVSVVQNQGTDISGVITGDVIWTKAFSPYYINGVVQVNGNLSIDPGVEIRGGRIELFRGSITMTGTAIDPIILRDNNIAINWEECSLDMKYVIGLNWKFNSSYQNYYQINNCAFMNSTIGTLRLSGWAQGSGIDWKVSNNIFISTSIGFDSWSFHVINNLFSALCNITASNNASLNSFAQYASHCTTITAAAPALSYYLSWENNHWYSASPSQISGWIKDQNTNLNNKGIIGFTPTLLTADPLTPVEDTLVTGKFWN